MKCSRSETFEVLCAKCMHLASMWVINPIRTEVSEIANFDPFYFFPLLFIFSVYFNSFFATSGCAIVRAIWPFTTCEIVNLRKEFPNSFNGVVCKVTEFAHVIKTTISHD